MPRAPARARRVMPFVLAGAWGAAATVWRLACPTEQQEGMGARIATSAVFLAVGGGLLYGVWRAPARELKRVRKIARAAQEVLLRPLPPRLEGLAVAAGQLSAYRGAAVGGDLYEAVATPHGVRVVIGDVRGHGLAAVGAAAAVLGSFREAAHDEPRLCGVLGRLDRALQRHLRERARAEHPAAGGPEPDSPTAEEFVTVLLLEIRPDGAMLAVNCGHPWPYRLRHGASRQLAPGPPLPPLGLFPLPEGIPVHRCAPLLPGEVLFLHTDGAEDARDADGKFFGLEEVLTETALGPPAPPAALIHRVHTALLRHTRGRLTDDVALMVLRNDGLRVPAQSAEPGLRRSRREPSNR
ncbi:PP2C family protein-serine/threonine phosphatase [Streptomyces sp. NPDC054841]